ncbi:hypothetical protein [Diaphorobacter aerolatus]|uniref:Uncharacterized protein n=1 Tax=Diaphorobacter aerolatus TaxID=1288495 RepID=A0A7H0GFW9_9BURK|nr:hypothetical protein [Diaphorobacter aerolatus]QNP47185.1 hypothetical protein H9K75_12290 [Diaphorobacter aerolatus]
MDLNSTAPVAPPTHAGGVSARWIWVALVALVLCMVTLAGVWMLLPAFGLAQTAGTAQSAAPQKPGSADRGTAQIRTKAADVAQGIQAPEFMNHNGSTLRLNAR